MPAGWALSGLLATAAALPAVWWSPLHVDEKATLWFAPRSYGTIVHDIFVERGGAPVFFFLEHLTLAWPGGLEGLRFPAFLFFLLALPAAGLVCQELCGRTEAVFTMVALALSPLAAALAVFARMYSLFLLLVLLVTWLALRAGKQGERGRWAVVGALAASLAYVHPIAPLYSILALASGLLWSDLPVRQLARQAWPAAAGFLLVALPYGYALAVLGARYDVGSAGLGSRGRSVPEQSLYALTTGEKVGAITLLLLALAGLGRLLYMRRRAGIILALWVATPVAFFSLVPAGGTRFFDRYLLPALTPFLLIVAVGALTAGRSLGRRRTVVGALVLAGVLALEAPQDFNRLRELRRLQLDRLVAAVEPHRDTGILFSSTGTRASARPPELLDDYVGLELPGIERIEELPAIDPWYDEGVARRGTGEMIAFLNRERAPRIGLWVFGGRPERVEAMLGRVARVEGVVAIRVSPRLLLVRSTSALSPRALVEQAYDVRAAWATRMRQDRLVRIILAVDRAALERAQAVGSSP